ncbi:MAG TPA: hypothetical protein EYP28_05650 [Methanophagales archaeon]|nr:hypothetical protein [Methanophagales archaeon]
MAEKLTHKKVKSEVAGKTGRKEVPIKGGRRLDVMTKYKAVEIERGGPSRLEKAAQRLKSSRKSQKVLVVPSKSMSKAREAMREVGVSGTVRNISGTKRSYVPKTTGPSSGKRRK